MPDTPATPVSIRAALLSAVGIWATYFLLVTLRSFMTDADGHVEMMGRRAIVALAGVGLTLAMWLVMRRLTHRSLAVQVAIMVQLAVPAAIASGWINSLAFSDMDKGHALLDDGTTRIVKDGQGNFVIAVPGAPRLVVRDPHADNPTSFWKEVSDVALGRYFLLIAWGAMFLALSNAARLRAAERREAELRRAAKAAELRSLRYQVNPHFLFNTLNSLSALVLAGRATDAEAMIQTLATFYRTSLTSEPTADVPLEEEVRLQRLYLEIEGVRFPERLQTAFDIPEDLADVCVPGLILQPLVENAIKHAVAPTTRPVRVTVAAEAAGGQLRLSVRDDGPGVSHDSSGCGIGLRNVRDRLAARFGAGARLRVDETPPGYAVLIDLPLTRQGC